MEHDSTSRRRTKRIVVEAGAPVTAANSYRPTSVGCAGHDLAQECHIPRYRQPFIISRMGDVVHDVAFFRGADHLHVVFGNRVRNIRWFSAFAVSWRRPDDLPLARLYQSLPPPIDATRAFPPPAPRSPYCYSRGRGVDCTLGTSPCHCPQRYHDRPVRCGQGGRVIAVVSVCGSD